MPQHSRPGTILGTVGYMSPEQAQGHLEDIDHRTDIFAFGCILFEAVTGQRAFEGKDALDSLHKIVHAPTPQIKELNPDAPPELQRIIRRCLAKDPDKRLTQVAVADNAQIAPASETQYGGITFSKDGNFIYVVRTDKDTPDGALYQVGVLSGNAKKVLVNITSAITFSPDGKQLAFVRCRGCTRIETYESAVIVANADGSNARTLAMSSPPELFSLGGPAWSPDGSTIACGLTHRGGGGYRQVVALRVADGELQPISSQRWPGPGMTLMRLAWLSDNSGILVSGAETGSVSQIWYLAWPGDEARNITNDVNSYTQTSLTADSVTLSTVLENRVINLWTASSQDMTGATRITSGADRSDGERGISWTPDGKLVYFSRSGGVENIWMMNGDGSGNKQLSPTAQQNVEPAVSPDGRYVVWASRPSGGWELWRMDIDGSNPKVLSRGGFFQDVSQDGRWVIFTPPTGKLLKVPIDGGKPVPVTEAYALRPVISPDGQFVACNYQDKSGEDFKVAILPFADGPANQTARRSSIWWFISLDARRSSDRLSRHPKRSFKHLVPAARRWSTKTTN
jgi:Tol biopolymer transport system component